MLGSHPSCTPLRKVPWDPLQEQPRLWQFLLLLLCIPALSPYPRWSGGSPAPSPSHPVMPPLSCAGEGGPASPSASHPDARISRVAQGLPFLTPSIHPSTHPPTPPSLLPCPGSRSVPAGGWAGSAAARGARGTRVCSLHAVARPQCSSWGFHEGSCFFPHGGGSVASFPHEFQPHLSCLRGCAFFARVQKLGASRGVKSAGCDGGAASPTPRGSGPGQGTGQDSAVRCPSLRKPADLRSKF